MRRNLAGIPTIDSTEVMVFTIAYECWRCPQCNGRRIEHSCRNHENSFRCVTCPRIVCRAEMAAVDAAEMRGDVWPV